MVNGTKNTRKRRHLQINKNKKEINTCGYRSACISEGDWTKGRGFNESIKTKTKQNKTKVTPEKDVMAFANQTPGGSTQVRATCGSSQQGRANQHEPPRFGLSSPWPFRHVRAYYCMPQSSPGFLCSDPFRHEMFRPKFHRSVTFPLALGCSRPLAGVDAESSEVVQETPPSTFFFPGPPHSLWGIK